MAEKKFNVPPNILYYSFDLVGWGSADIARFVMGDFIPHFLQSTSQGSYIFVVFFFAHSPLKIA